ncbi:hypothetical protein LPJ78_000185 [Coemansia sp. RSA 989]|nr:hypothetical protein LPJ68_001760 [Coemansia sp. RSA 1086]KAJ1868437.1 hypothetical protein LPJ78_000185 [Coemansia sp. RSA 989]KAJ1875131.1 hypothetical protein LPJ55_000942 [Coemansia sp. RSA 990]
MSLDQIRKDIADSRSSDSPQPPIGGRYIALLRRTPTGMLFSDPVYIATDQQLPELPDGVQYIVVHPLPTTEKPPTMEAYMPKNALKKPEPAEKQTPILLKEETGLYSSFMPTRDTSLASLSASDYTTLSGGMVGSSQDMMDSALNLANKVLGEMQSGEGDPGMEITAATLQELGLLPSDIGLDNKPPGSIETAESLLDENNRLLAQLQMFQDKRAQSGDYGAISQEEQKIAARLQLNLTRAVAAQAPKQVRPPQEEIQRAVKLLMANSNSDYNGPSYSGTLPPQRRFAFMSNAVAGSSVPQNATLAPMQRVPHSKQ